MDVVTAPLTVEEFLELPEPEGEKIELIGGELYTVPKAGYPHEKTKGNWIRALSAWAPSSHIGDVFSETAYELSPDTCAIPDVSFVRAGRIPEDTRGVIRLAPDAAIEVVSSEKAENLERKVEAYLAHGCRCVIINYPMERFVRVEEPGRSRRLHEGEFIDDIEALPGFRVAVAAVFAGVK